MTDHSTPRSLDMVRVRGTAYIAKNLAAPWGVHIDEHPHLSRFHLVVKGSTWIGLPGEKKAHRLSEGDIAIVFNGRAHTYFSDGNADDLVAMAYPTPTSKKRFEPFDEASADTHMLCGYFEFADTTPPVVLARIPTLLVGSRHCNSAGDVIGTISRLAREELSKSPMVSEVLLNRLTEILCISTIQAWLEKQRNLSGTADTFGTGPVHAALDLIHATPDKSWTLDTLARICGRSRSVFFDEFRQATGTSPMNYLRQWRIGIARELLRDPKLSIKEIAGRIGYADANTFNRAFKRETGETPGIFRKTSSQLSASP